MRDLSAELAYFTMVLGRNYGDEVVNGRPLPDGAILAEIEAAPFRFGDEEKAEVLRALEARTPTRCTCRLKRKSAVSLPSSQRSEVRPKSRSTASRPRRKLGH